VVKPFYSVNDLISFEYSAHLKERTQIAQFLIGPTVEDACQIVLARRAIRCI
jgi:hypothetical protein